MFIYHITCTYVTYVCIHTRMHLSPEKNLKRYACRIPSGLSLSQICRRICALHLNTCCTHMTYASHIHHTHMFIYSHLHTSNIHKAITFISVPRLDPKARSEGLPSCFTNGSTIKPPTGRGVSRLLYFSKSSLSIWWSDDLRFWRSNIP